MTTATFLAACCALLLVSLAAAQSPTPTAVPTPGAVPPPEVRKAEIRARMPNNEFINDPVRGEETVQRMIALQDEIVDAGGCNPNLCFGIDGSRFISEVDYERQLNFMGLIAATVGASLGFEDKIAIAAYQYGGALRVFTRPTRDVEKLFEAIETKNFRRSRFSFLAPPILACRLDFERNFIDDANKMVLIGNGNTNFRSPSVAVNEAKMFLPPFNNGAICAVTFDKPNLPFWNDVTQNPARVLHIDQTSQFVNLLEQVVRDVCNLV